MQGLAGARGEKADEGKAKEGGVAKVKGVHAGQEKRGKVEGLEEGLGVGSEGLEEGLAEAEWEGMARGVGRGLGGGSEGLRVGLVAGEQEVLASGVGGGLGAEDKEGVGAMVAAVIPMGQVGVGTIWA